MKIDKFSNIDKRTITKILTFRDKLTKEQMHIPISIGNTQLTLFNSHLKGEDIGLERSDVVALEQEGFIKILSDLDKMSSENNWGCLVELTEKTIKFEDYKKRWESEKRKEFVKYLIPIIISVISLMISIISYK